MPQVSVIIPTHDRSHLLLRAVGSVLAQESVSLELIVVDDGSRDDTRAVLATIRDPRLRVVAQPSAGGASSARNLGMSKAAGDWIAFLDDDDLWAPSKLRIQLLRAEETGASVVWNAALVVDEDGRAVRIDAAAPAEGIFGQLCRRNAIGTPSCVAVRRGLVEQLGGFDPSLFIVEDWDLWLRLLSRASGVACVEPLTGYLLHAQNLHLDQLERLDEALALLEAKHRGLLDIDRGWLDGWIAGALAYSGAGWRRPFVSCARRAGTGTPQLASRAFQYLVGPRITSALRSVTGKTLPEIPTPEWAMPSRREGAPVEA